ncbi:MAG TPA: hypothetical protein VG708_04905 [Mycobacteriales bacterium]|nr:hypothetical protein [Mycobacteriales bacterium]
MVVVEVVPEEHCQHDERDRPQRHADRDHPHLVDANRLEVAHAGNAISA